MFEKFFYGNGLVNVFLESSVPLSFTLGGFDENIKPTDSESVVRSRNASKTRMYPASVSSAGATEQSATSTAAKMSGAMADPGQDPRGARC
jgi:hypothetical protein